MSYRNRALVTCPKCAGLCHLVEHHVLDGEALRIEHNCILCESRGFVSVEIARTWWMHRNPST